MVVLDLSGLHLICIITLLTEIVINILWNIHEYFKQFLPNVEAKIKELKSPIDRKLKDYVKIVKWKDISYWSVKDTIEKTQKALHKHIREFEVQNNTFVY